MWTGKGRTFLAFVHHALRRVVLVRLLARVAPIRQVSVGSWRLRVDLRDHVIARELYVWGSFEPELEEVLRDVPLRGRTLIDVGANIGLHTLLFAALAGPEGKVFAFEPEAANFEHLQHNLKVNAAANVIAVQVALGNEEGQRELNLNPFNFGDYRLAGQPWSADVSRQRIKVTRLDTALADAAPGTIGLIKIDVQGWEHEVLNGMRAVLKKNPEVLLFLELSPLLLRQAGSSSTEVLGQLQELDFAGYEIHPDRAIPMLTAEDYDLIRAGAFAERFAMSKHEFLRREPSVNLLLCRNRQRLREIVRRFAARPLSNRSPWRSAPSPRPIPSLGEPR